MTMSIFDFFKADKYHVKIFLEYHEEEYKRLSAEEMIMVMIDNKLYEIELGSAYLCNDGVTLLDMVTIKRSLNDVIDDWNNAEYWKVLNVETTKIE